MSTNPTISVIMPCYNAASYVKDAVNSVLSQTYQDIELIIVDDGSADDSKTIIDHLCSEHSEQITILHQQNKGPYPARNLALKQAKGEFIAFLDADDYWEPECLAKLHKAIINKSADIAYCGWQNVGKGGPGTEPYIPPAYEQGDIVSSFIKGCPWPIHAALCKHDVIDKLDGFSERYFSSMDFDLWIRLLTVTKNITLVPEVLAYYRWHDSGQISAIKWKQVLESWAVRNDFIQQNPDLVKHINKSELERLTHGFILTNAYNAYWKRDMASAQKLFRKILSLGYFKVKDIKYLAISLLPLSVLTRLFQNKSNSITPSDTGK